MDRQLIKVEPDECIPTQHLQLQLQFNGCHRCSQQDAQIQALQVENGKLKRIRTEQNQMIEKLKAELAKLQCKPDEFEHFIVMPLSPFETGSSITPQSEKCSVCQTESMTNDDQEHICNGAHQIGCEYCEQIFTSTMDLIEHSNAYHNEKSFYCCTKCPEMFSMAQLLQFHEMTHPVAEPFFCNIEDGLDEHLDTNHKRPRRTKDSKNQTASKTPPLLITSPTSDNLSIDKPIVRPRTKPAKKTQKTTKVKPFKCSKCSECFTSSKKVTVHMKRVHARSFECSICKEKCKSLLKTQIHMRQHIRTEKCEVCQELYTKLELEAHICCGLKSINCGYCQQAFTTTKSLLQHLQVCKSEKVSHACGSGTCTKFFLMKLLADLHRKHHKDTEPTKKYACSVCGNNFSSFQDVLLHKKQHTEARSFLCDECGKGFLCAENLRHHKQTHAFKKNPIKCKECNFTCLSTLTLRKHMLKHQNITFVCNICDLQLSSPHKLSIHKKIHTRTEADRVHGCTQCDKKYLTRKSARAHFLAAHNTIRFECDLCDQSYKYKGDLNKHKRAVHSVGYSFACPHCEKRFAQSYELDRHLFEHSTVPAAEQPLPV